MKPLIIAVITCVSITSLSAQSLEKNVKPFKKIIVSPKINLVMVPGATESVRINYSNIDPSKINVVVKNKTLHIYLDGSKYTEKQNRIKMDGWVKKENAYKNVSITAYVTYHQIGKLVVRGEQEVDVQGALENRKFKLSAYGECTITMASLQAFKFKASLYGQHNVKINGGNVEMQKYKLFGENKIDTQAIQSDEIASSTYGESKLKVNATENLKLVTFGESDVFVKGSPEVNRFTFGEVSVKR